MNKTNFRKHYIKFDLFSLLVFLVGVCLVSVLATLLVVRSQRAVMLGRDVNNDQEENGRMALPLHSSADLQVFRGVLPCADCQGIQAELSLQKNKDDVSEGIYAFKQVYMGKRVSPVTSLGKWNVQKGRQGDPQAILIRLEAVATGEVVYWWVVDNNTIQMLDSQRRQMKGSGEFVLKRLE